MFTDPETFLLNVTNAGLGALVLAFCLAAAYVVVKEIRGRVLASRQTTAFSRAPRPYRFDESLGGGACGAEPASGAD